MNSPKLISQKNLFTVGFIALLIALAAFSFSLWQTPSYKSTVKLLAVFNQSNIDTYTASKTANYITGIMGEVIYSDSFIDSVYANGNGLTDTLGQGSEKRQKAWKKIVKTQILDNRGIIIIDVYGDEKIQTNLLASTIGAVIASQHGLYDGSQDRVSIKMIDTPSVYESWSGVKIMSDTGLGFLTGLLIGLTLVVIFPNHKLFEFKKKNRSAFSMSGAAAQKFQAQPASTDLRIADQPAPESIKEILADSASRLANSAAGEHADRQAENTHGKISNPWLDQYYEENLNGKSNQNS